MSSISVLTVLQSSLFQDDLFPPTKDDAAVVSIPEWLGGVTRLPNKVSLKGNLQSGLRIAAAVSAPAPAAAPVSLQIKPSAPAASSPAMQPKSSFTPKPLGQTSAPSPVSSGPVPPVGEAALLKAWHAQQKEIEELKQKLAQLGGR
jgi:hypothetical protein